MDVCIYVCKEEDDKNEIFLPLVISHHSMQSSFINQTLLPVPPHMYIHTHIRTQVDKLIDDMNSFYHGHSAAADEEGGGGAGDEEEEEEGEPYFWCCDPLVH